MKLTTQGGHYLDSTYPSGIRVPSSDVPVSMTTAAMPSEQPRGIRPTSNYSIDFILKTANPATERLRSSPSSKMCIKERNTIHHGKDIKKKNKNLVLAVFVFVDRAKFLFCFFTST